MKNVMLYLVVLLTCCLAASHAIRWVDCGSPQGKVTTVEVGGCAQSQTCELKKGTNATFMVEFSPKEDITKATVVVHGILDRIPIPFPVPCSSACDDCGLTCPVKAGTDTKFTAVFPVRTAYPSVKVLVKFELKDPKNDDLFCVEIPAEIVS